MAEAMAEPLPGAVYGLHSCLVKLEVRHHIDSAKMAFGIESHDSAEVTHLLILARDAAKILADGYKDSTLLVEVERLIVQMLGISLEEFLEQYKLNKMR
jgi:hypothetical protein